MKTKTTISTITAFAIASMLLISGFSLPAVYADESDPVVKKIKIAPVAAQEAIYKSQSRTIGYVYIFEACAGDDPIISPEILVKSDSEVRSVKLATDLGPRACQISSTIIKAASPDTISGVLEPEYTLIKMAIDNGKKVSDIKIMISEKNTELQSTIKQPESDAKTSKIAKITGELVDLRQQLKDARSEYYRALFLIYG